MHHLLGMAERFHARGEQFTELMTQYRSLESWHPVLPQKTLRVPESVVNVGGEREVYFKLLCSPAELQAEDKIRIDLGGKACVGVMGYDRRCQESTSNSAYIILSLREKDAEGNEKFLSTVELHISGKKEVQILQNYDALNKNPPSVARRAVDWLKDEIASGRIPLDLQRVGKIVATGQDGEVFSKNDISNYVRHVGIDPRTDDGSRRLNRVFELLTDTALSPLRDPTRPEGSRRENIRPIPKDTFTIYDFIAGGRVATVFEELGMQCRLDQPTRTNNRPEADPTDYYDIVQGGFDETLIAAYEALADREDCRN